MHLEGVVSARTLHSLMAYELQGVPGSKDRGR